MLVKNLGWALGGRSRGVEEKGVEASTGTAGEIPDMWEALTMDVVLTVEGRMDLSSLSDGFMVGEILVD